MVRAIRMCGLAAGVALLGLACSGGNIQSPEEGAGATLGVEVLGKSTAWHQGSEMEINVLDGDGNIIANSTVPFDQGSEAFKDLSLGPARVELRVLLNAQSVAEGAADFYLNVGHNREVVGLVPTAFNDREITDISVTVAVPIGWSFEPVDQVARPSVKAEITNNARLGVRMEIRSWPATQFTETDGSISAEKLLNSLGGATIIEQPKELDLNGRAAVQVVFKRTLNSGPDRRIQRTVLVSGSNVIGTDFDVIEEQFRGHTEYFGRVFSAVRSRITFP